MIREYRQENVAYGPADIKRVKQDPGNFRATLFIPDLAVCRTVLDRLTSDFGIYAITGLFSLVVFAVALGILATTLPDGLGETQLIGLVIGYLLFVGVYAAAWFIYQGIESREEV